MAGRYAVYFVPHHDSLLWQLGCAWHGRDPAQGRALSVPPLPAGLSAERYQAIVAAPRRYGFHATLKPPFALAEGRDGRSLADDVAALSGTLQAVIAPALQVTRIGGFLALTPTARATALDRLCAELVEKLDGYRAPASAAELAERRKAKLSARQEKLLQRWGYPYVMEEWTFHMTLTTWLEEPERSLVERHLLTVFRPVMAAPLYVDRIALFRQESHDAPFDIVETFLLGSGERLAPLRGTMSPDEIVEEADRESMDASDAPGYYALRTGGPEKD